MDKEKTRALQNTMQEWTDVRQSRALQGRQAVMPAPGRGLEATLQSRPGCSPFASPSAPSCPPPLSSATLAFKALGIQGP